MGRSFAQFPGDFKPPPMGTYLHVSRSEVNQNPVTKPGLKQGLVVMFWPPKIASEAISQHQIQKHYSWGSMPPHPPTFCVHTNIATRVFVPIRQTNTTPSPLRSDYSSYAGHLYEITLGHCCRGQELFCTLIVLYMACLSLCFITLQYPTYTLGVC